MTTEQRIQAFIQLGNHIRTMSEEAFDTIAENALQENPWFTKKNVRLALDGISQYLMEDHLKSWIARYSLTAPKSKTVALVLAGNIPLVGFHDFLCVMLSGHQAQIKLSSKDSKLFQYLVKHLVWLAPQLQERITFKDKLENFDAIIATGSDNSARHFEYYFSKYPHIIRKNRTSCAILTGEETGEEITNLGTDIFSYFGLGCRNVSKVYVPQEYDFKKLFAQWEPFKEIIHHHKYCNNYDYQKSILLVNGAPFLDNGFLLLQESDKAVSPISVLYFERYASAQERKHKLEHHADKIQCIVGNEKPATVLFGQAQFPRVWDYADQVDTMKFLSAL